MYKIIFLLSLISITTSCKKDSGPIVELDVISDTIQLVAPGVISTALYERDFAISPKGDEIIFTRGDFRQHYRCLIQIRKRNGEWQEARILPFSGTFQDIEPFISPDGQTLFFA